MPRKSEGPNLTVEEREWLTTVANSHKAEKRMSERSCIILDWANGLSYQQTQEKNHLSQMTIAKWRKRFKINRIEGLKDDPRPGKPPIITEAQRKKIIHLACSKPDNGKQRRSQQEIAEEVEVSQSMVSEILQNADLKPHKTEYWCGKSPDPEFEAKMLNIVGLYLNPPEKAVVISVDEKTQIQALDRTQPELPMKTGKVRRLTNTYKRNGTANLIAALAVHSGEVTARTVEKNNSENFLKFLKYLDRKYRNVELHLIVDNLTVHKNKTVKDWVDRKRKFHLHFTPTYSSWLNQIEIWFGLLTRNVLKDAVWKSKKEMVDQMMHYIKYYNEYEAKPFQWTYGKDKIN